MKKYTFFALFILLFTLFACSSQTTEQKVEANTTETINSSEEAVQTSSTTEESKAVTVSQEEPATENTKNKEEIELINMEVMLINESLALYTKEENTANWETLACQRTEYKNENGIVVKVTAVCGDHSWEIYSTALSKTDSKLLYGKYLENVTDDRLPTIREFYSIGSMIPSENAYTMIMDESGKEVDPAGYRKFSVLYEAAFDAFY